MNNSSRESTKGSAKALLGPLTLRDTLATAGALLILIGSMIPILMVGGYFSNLWMLPGGFFYPLITLVLPILTGGAFAWRRFAGRTALRVGSQTLDQIGSVIALLGTGYFFFSMVATFTPAFLIALIGSLALLGATTLAPFIKPLVADFAPGTGHLLTRDVLPSAATAAATASVTAAETDSAAKTSKPKNSTVSAAASATPLKDSPVASAQEPLPAKGKDEVKPKVETAAKDAPEAAAAPAAAVSVSPVAPVDEVMVGQVVPVGMYVEDDAELADIVDAPAQGDVMAPNPAIARAAAAAALGSTATSEDKKPKARYEWPSANDPQVFDPVVSEDKPSEPQPSEASSAKPTPELVNAEVPAEADAPAAAEPVEPHDDAPVAEPAEAAVEPVIDPVVEPVAPAAKDSAQTAAPAGADPATSAHPVASGPAPTAAFSRIELEEKLKERPEIAEEPEAFGATHHGDSRTQAFWFAVLDTRTVYNESTGAPAFEIHPGAWVLALEDRGHEFVVQDSDGKLGVLRQLNDIERG